MLYTNGALQMCTLHIYVEFVDSYAFVIGIAFKLKNSGWLKYY